MTNRGKTKEKHRKIKDNKGTGKEKQRKTKGK